MLRWAIDDFLIRSKRQDRWNSDAPDAEAASQQGDPVGPERVIAMTQFLSATRPSQQL